MAEIAVTKPYSLKSATLTIDTDGFSSHVSQVQFDPSTSQSTWRAINSTVIRDQSVAEWSCTIGLVQDLASGGLLRYLIDHEGEKKPCVFIPKDGGPSIAATLVISPSTIGGTADGSTATASVTMAVDGKPVFTDN